MSIILKKNRSGSWGLAEKAHGLKAWQRLWIASALIYFLLVVAGGWLLMPTRGRIERDMVFAVTEEVRKYEGLVFAGSSPEKIFEAARAEGYSAWITGLRKKSGIGREGDAGFARIENEYRRDIETLPLRRLRLSALLFLAWVGPMAGFYAAGCLVDWINRGNP